MDEKKKSVVPPQEKIEELCDAQLSQVNGGLSIPTISGSDRLGGLKPGQGLALEKPTCFTKSGDKVPPQNGL
ncbi:MAG: hypothetical protein IKK75_16045, partial [Clostridia bacterium]|nr:hypothetical protein [Clostridia bacterium]